MFLWYMFLWVIVKQETKQKRNETKQAEMKRNETQQKRNETKQNKIINNWKNETNIKETIFFYMRQQFTKCQWRTETPLTFSGIWENFVQPPPLQCTYSILFGFSECLDPLLKKKKISPFPYPVFPPEICNDFFF